MNQLSWLLYLADVGNSAEGWFAFFGVIAGIITIISIIVGAFVNVICSSENDDHGRPLNDERIAERKQTRKETNGVLGRLLWTFAPLGFICVVLTAAIPSRDTVYAIAASELGEKVASSQVGQKAGQAIEAWLDRQISGVQPSAPAQGTASTPAS